MFDISSHKKFCAAPLVATLFASLIVVVLTTSTGKAQTITIDIGKGLAIQVPEETASVFIADQTIADIKTPKPGQFFIYGIAVGTTTVSATNHNGELVMNRLVIVRHDTIQARHVLAERYPHLALSVQSADGTLMISGNVPNQTIANEIIATVTPLAQGDKVINRLSVATPGKVRLYVRLIQIDRDTNNSLGIDWRGVLGAGAALLSGNVVDLNSTVDLMIDKGVATVISEPSLTANSGETAVFQVGGEIPVPGKARETENRGLIGGGLDYKFIGMKLKFTPNVNDSAAINLDIQSDITSRENGSSSVNGDIFPALGSKAVSTSVTLAHGQSFVLAGLSELQLRGSLKRFPTKKRIPLLSAIFEKDTNTITERETIIVVTPYLVSNQNKQQLPTEITMPVNNIEHILLSRASARRRANSKLRYINKGGFAY